MREFSKGEVCEFWVQHVGETNGQKYIFLSDGQVHTYRVRAYDFQTEWEEHQIPKTINCYVRDVNIYGLPLLVQVRKDLLESCYSDLNTEYPFKVIAKEIDANTNIPFLKLKDPYGLEHRYYPSSNEPEREVTDIFSLIFKGIESNEGNKAHLILEYIDVEAQANELSQEGLRTDSIDVSELENGKNFGVENDEREFKSTIIFPGGSTEADIDKQMKIIVQTIAGFQNKSGGELYIGVNDSGNVCGINHDYELLNSSTEDTIIYNPNPDGYELKIRNSVKRALGNTSNANLTFEFGNEANLDYCIIEIKPVLKPVFVYGIRLFQRAGNMTQMLKGDEITWFVEERFKQRNQSLFSSLPLDRVTFETKEEDDDDQAVSQLAGSAEKLSVSKTTEPPAKKVWYYITFYSNGGWSFQKNAVDSKEVVLQIPVTTNFKNEPLMMAYENGCVNAIIPNDLINPKSPKGGRKLRKVGHLYSNGWNKKSNLLSVFSVRKDDLVVFKSVHEDGTEYCKIHNSKAISIHVTPHLEGNKVINPNLDAKVVEVKPLSKSASHFISSLILKDYQTSGYLGVRTSEKNYHNTMKSLNKLLQEEYS